MPQISQRGHEMPQSAIRKLVPFAEQAKKEGVKVYHLNIGQPDIPTPEVALDAVRNHGLNVVAYTHSAGNESFRKKLAAYYNYLSIDIDYTNILITTGGSEALVMTFSSCFNPGEELIVPEPYYANYNNFAGAAEINIKPITSKIENAFALPPVEEFEKIITNKTKGILLSNPNNPTGRLYSLEEMQQLKTIVKKYDLYLIVDEVYREFCYDGLEHHSCMELKGVENNVILIDSMSKRYSACGLRIGALVTRNQEVINTAYKFANARLSPPSFGQIAGEALLSTPKTYFKEVYNEYMKRRDFTINTLNAIEGVFCPVPKGAFYTMVRFPVDDGEKFAKWMLQEFRHKNQTVMLAPGSGFYTTKGIGRNEIRIAYVLNIQDLENAFECLKAGLENYPGRVEKNTKEHNYFASK